MNTTEALNNALEFVEELDRELTLSSNLELKRGRLEQQLVRALAAQSASAPAAERAGLRAAQAAAVMPLIGPLLDAWENADREVLGQEPELSRQLAAINRAMEDADITHAQPAREPMTNEQIMRLSGDCYRISGANPVVTFARAIEAHHGITDPSNNPTRTK